MIRIDDTLLEEIGLIALPKQDRDQLLRQIYETLEMRVGMKLAERMTDQQLDEFERFIDTNDEAGALKWLETNFPDYKQVVADELEKLKLEIKNDSGKILETMQAQPGQVPANNPNLAGQTQQPAQFNPAPAPQPFTPQPSYDQQPTAPAQPSLPPQQPYSQPPVAGPAQPPAFGQPPQTISPQQSHPTTDQPDENTTQPSQQSGSIPPPPSF